MLTHIQTVNQYMFQSRPVYQILILTSEKHSQINETENFLKVNHLPRHSTE